MKRLWNWCIVLALATGMIMPLASCDKDSDDDDAGSTSTNTKHKGKPGSSSSSETGGESGTGNGSTPGGEYKEIQVDKYRFSVVVDTEVEVKIEEDGEFTVSVDKSGRIKAEMQPDSKTVKITALTSGGLGIATITDGKRKTTISVWVYPHLRLEKDRVETELKKPKPTIERVNVPAHWGSLIVTSEDEKIAEARGIIREGEMSYIEITCISEGTTKLKVVDWESKEEAFIVVNIKLPYNPDWNLELVSGAGNPDIVAGWEGETMQLSIYGSNPSMTVTYKGIDGAKPFAYIDESSYRVVKLPTKAVMVCNLIVARSHEMNQRAMHFTLAANGQSVEIQLVQDKCPMDQSRNLLAFFARSNLASYGKNNSGTFAETPTLDNQADWGEERFGRLYRFPEDNDEFKSWRAKIGKHEIWGLPTAREFTELTSSDPESTVINPNNNLIRYDTYRMHNDEWPTIKRTEFLENGVKITARALEPGAAMPTKEEYGKEKFWTDCKLSGSDVVRYFPQQGYKNKSGVLKKKEMGYYWTSTNVQTNEAYHFWILREPSINQIRMTFTSRELQMSLRPILREQR